MFWHKLSRGHNSLLWIWRGGKSISCLDCEYVEFGNMPNRRCSLNKVEHIWTMDADTELSENGFTQAEKCDSFRVYSETEGIAMIWNEQ